MVNARRVLRSRKSRAVAYLKGRLAEPVELQYLPAEKRNYCRLVVEVDDERLFVCDAYDHVAEKCEKIAKGSVVSLYCRIIVHSGGPRQRAVVGFVVWSVVEERP